MNYKPLVSIVIPAYNASNYLAEAIDSALAQTYDNIEIIVVNDGSKDAGATADVAKQYQGKILYFEKENGGSSSAINLGIKNMKGDWFSWLSHDDLYYPEKVAEQIQYLNSLQLTEEDIPNHVFFAASERVNAQGKCIKHPDMNTLQEKANLINNIVGNQVLIAEPTKFNFHGCSCLVHKSVFQKIGMFDERLRLLNDFDMWFRIYAAGYKIHYTPKVLVQGRVHAKQVSRSIGFSYHNPEQDMFWNRSLDWLIEHCPNDFDLYQKYGANAYEKTRYQEGHRAFKHATDLNPSKKFPLTVLRFKLIIKSSFKTFLKKLYITFRL